MGDNIKAPSHYVDGRKYEPKDVIRDWGLNFNLGSAVKYISRAGRKGDKLEDLQKAKQFLEFEIEEIESKKESDELWYRYLCPTDDRICKEEKTVEESCDHSLADLVNEIMSRGDIPEPEVITLKFKFHDMPEGESEIKNTVTIKFNTYREED